MSKGIVSTFGLPVLLVSMLSLAACSNVPTRPAVDPATVPDAVPKVEPFSKTGNPESYEQFGKRYWVLPSPYGFVQRGKASWYGKKFHGRRTSSGETYDMYAMSAAHKTLPIPTYARVTNLDNGRSVVVRINDRGPFVDDRIVDLSFSAASRLGMIGPGTANVELRVLDPHERPDVRVASNAPKSPESPSTRKAASGKVKPVSTGKAAASAATPASEAGVRVVQMPILGKTEASAARSTTPAVRTVVMAKPAIKPSIPSSTSKGRELLFLQLAAFASEKNAEAARAKLMLVQQNNVKIEKTTDALGTLYRVKIGPFVSAEEAKQVAQTLKPHGYDQYRIVKH